ncbi:transcription antitermination factor NusB [Woodsholea maritima]|uniref:transcription antitermination factor NusB n=1 Tax=Woodsholea maritima TaxID=240237 RepID=UPI00037DDFE6|nr:transcription antitermination factor NusB [Woodsholea maritima]
MTETASQSRARLRRTARLAAVQALYQMEISGRGAREVTLEFLNHRLKPRDYVPDRVEENAEGEGEGEMHDLHQDDRLEADETFFENLLEGVVKAQNKVDSLAAETLKEGWSLKRIDATVRAILRSGGYELVERNDVPAKVVIDEYVEITKAFFEGPEPGFVNGTLDAIARKARPDEF